MCIARSPDGILMLVEHQGSRRLNRSLILNIQAAFWIPQTSVVTPVQSLSIPDCSLEKVCVNYSRTLTCRATGRSAHQIPVSFNP